MADADSVHICGEHRSVVARSYWGRTSKRRTSVTTIEGLGLRRGPDILLWQVPVGCGSSTSAIVVLPGRSEVIGRGTGRLSLFARRIEREPSDEERRCHVPAKLVPLAALFAYPRRQVNQAASCKAAIG